MTEYKTMLALIVSDADFTKPPGSEVDYGTFTTTPHVPITGTVDEMEAEVHAAVSGVFADVRAAIEV